ncbi:DNA recombination and repair protein RecO [plant metagenome]|uniref:DNA repair protein RecO n=1 Tax=plant metagenome TaxID=1297885 RepID=A0A484V7K0_9ZZZZ
MSRRGARVQDAAGYMLHATPWRETSLVVQAFSREHGCVAMVAKGAKRPYSTLRPVLNAFQPLLLSWTGMGEVKTLTRAESAGIHALAGGALMSAWYMNELLLRLLPREDPHPVLYDAYVEALRQLAGGQRAAAALRRFEWVLLRETGYGVDEDEPDFGDAQREPALRASLRERLADQLAGRPLATRRVLMELQRL